MNAPEASLVAQQWLLSEPLTFLALQGGTNNQVWRVTDAQGTSYVLRLVPDATVLPRVRDEVALLHALRDCGVSFHLPIPLPTRAGADVCIRADGAFMTLTSFFAGSDPDEAAPEQAAEAGNALAELDRALASLLLPNPTQAAPRYGDLNQWMPLVSDPLGALEALPIDAQQRHHIRQWLAEVQGFTPALYARLPQQTVHRDYSAGNFLMEAGRVTCILDFEFAGWDLRALDLTVALSWWNVQAMQEGTIWPLFTAFASAYLARFPLTDDELLALPDLFRLRDATSFVHRMGRYLAGQETETRMIARVQHSLWREAWIAANGRRLCDEARQWRAS